MKTKVHISGLDLIREYYDSIDGCDYPITYYLAEKRVPVPLLERMVAVIRLMHMTARSKVNEVYGRTVAIPWDVLLAASLTSGISMAVTETLLRTFGIG